MSNIRSLSDLNKGSGGGRGGGGGGGGMPPNGGGGMPPHGGGGGGGPPNPPPGGFLGSFFGSMFGGGGNPAAGGGEDHKRVKVLHSDSEFPRELSAAGTRLVVVDFSAVWCGPCKMIGPVFVQLSEQYPNVVFLKVDVDEMQGTARSCGITAMPTFQFFVKGQKIDEFKGADSNKLQQTIARHAAAHPGGPSIPTTGGQALGGGGGNVLGGGGGGHVLGGGEGRGNLLDRLSAQTPVAPAPTPASNPSADVNMNESQSPPAPTPTPVVNRPPPSAAPFLVTPDPVMLQGLLDMGFPQPRAEKALLTVKNSSLQNAMDWIFEHMDDADIDTPVPPASTQPAATGDSATTTTTTTTQGEEPIVHNAICDECKKQIIGIRYKSKRRADYDLCENCKKITVAEDDDEFVAHTADITNVVLTPEEKALQQERLQKRIEEVRKKKKEDEESRDREREISRRKEGKETIEAKKQWEEATAKREAEKLRKEKEDEKRAKEAIKQKILQDKMERQARQQGSQQQAQQTAPVPVAATPAAPATPKTYTECQIQVRQLDGSNIRATFKPTDTLRTVHQYISSNRTDKQIGPFSLVNTFPRKVYGAAELDITLQQAGLVPNGTLLMQR